MKRKKSDKDRPSTLAVLIVPEGLPGLAVLGEVRVALGFSRILRIGPSVRLSFDIPSFALKDFSGWRPILRRHLEFAVHSLHEGLVVVDESLYSVSAKNEF